MRSRAKALQNIVFVLLLAVALSATGLACDKVTINPGTGEIIIETSSQPDGQPSTAGADWRLPSIEFFNSTPSSMAPGNTATLGWDVFGATEITIDQGIGDVERSGNSSVSPPMTTTYTLTATNAAGSVTKSVTVEVGTDTPPPSPPSPPPSPPAFTPSTPPSTQPASPPAVQARPVIISFVAEPSSIPAGATTNLEWNVTGATFIHISNGIGTLPYTTGYVTVRPSYTTTFTLTANGPGGTATRSVTVVVTSAAPPQPTSAPTIISFTAKPTSLSGAGTTTLSWSTSGATSVTLSPGGGSVPASGSATATLSSTRTYTLTATNSAGSVNRSVTVTVAAAPTSPPASPSPAAPPATPPVINTFTASPTSLSGTGTTTLTWSTSGATSVTLSPGIGSVPASGSATATLSSTRTYTLTATNSVGSANRSVTITVAAAPTSPPPASPSPADAAACEQALFNAVNAIRTSNGKAALARDSYIDGLCRQHAQYMAAAGNLSHDNFSARSNSIRANVPGMNACAENVLQDNTPCDANSMAQLWYNSSGHRTNMLNTAYTRAGMGIVIDGSGRIWACQIFAGP
ncbi:MAG: hypothetical protein FJ008_03035 [Chloroflexi bacterium]|nr:hypothetical protein [Chloroflexota bacterium]MBM3172614.1 hypothetical protein [Chloroflexota bacterium]MBM3174618.1 hypothetical protein [Chloroflexota bacterium]MBM4449547.1 hypothetical protein [Chloroflexota bacterium]